MRLSKDEITQLLKCNGISLLTEYKTTNDVCEYECLECQHTFSTLLKFKVKQCRGNKILCPKCAKKAKDIRMRKINPITGKNRYQEIAVKTAKTMNRVGDDGTSIYQKNADKLKKTVHTVNLSTGLTLAEERGQKTKENKSRIQENGLTKYQETAITSAKTKTKHFIDAIKLKFNEINILTTPDEYFNTKLITFSCKTCGTERTTFHPYMRCAVCYPHTSSNGEREVSDFCSNITKITNNDRHLIKPLEIDIVCEVKKIAIEYDGIFWHSSYDMLSENKNYHLNKTELCEAKGIQLFHIFENEWLDPIKQSIWKSIIANKLGKSTRLYARNCEIKTVSNVQKCEFLKANHLQGDCPSSVNVGLYHNNELVSIMTFSKSRFSKKYDWELLRFCNVLNTSVIGGASRLLKCFRTMKSGSIVSYADKRRSDGNLYKQLGFTHSHDSKPNYWYFKNGDILLESRVKYQKHKLSSLLEQFDSVLSESENMYNNGYRKIYDCGNQVWFLK